jgi:hypothetical protein
MGMRASFCEKIGFYDMTINLIIIVINYQSTINIVVDCWRFFHHFLFSSLLWAY